MGNSCSNGPLPASSQAAASEMPMKKPAGLKLVYYAVPGRGEATRMILTCGKVPFEEVEVTSANWPEMKPTMPHGQVPVLLLEDGRMLAQSGAIERYAASLAGLYPEEPLDAALADSAAFLVSEALELIIATFSETDPDAKSAARAALLAPEGGKLAEKLALLSKMLEDKVYIAGKALSWADIMAFYLLGSLRGGWDLDGVPTTVLDAYPTLVAYANRIASIEALKARYADATGARAAYKPQ